MQSSGMMQVTLASGRTTEETGHVRIENVFLFFYFSINFIWLLIYIIQVFQLTALSYCNRNTLNKMFLS